MRLEFTATTKNAAYLRSPWGVLAEGTVNIDGVTVPAEVHRYGGMVKVLSLPDHAFTVSILTTWPHINRWIRSSTASIELALKNAELPYVSE